MTQRGSSGFPQGYNGSERHSVHENHGKRNWTTLKSRTDRYTDTSGPQMTTRSELNNASIATSRKITIPANAGNLLVVLIGTLDEQQKALIEALPWDKADISTCASVMKQAKKCKEHRNAFAGIISQPEGGCVWIKIGNFDGEDRIKPMWAILCNKELRKNLLSLQYLTTSTSTGYRPLRIEDTTLNPTLNPTLRLEFEFL